MKSILSFVAISVVCIPGFLSESVAADDARSEEKNQIGKQHQFVLNKVLPLLESRCFKCHKHGKTPKGGLLLSSRKTMLKGGDSGPAIVPGKPDESLLIEAVRYEGFEMPPRSRMPEEEIQILEKWVADGASWPADLETKTAVVETEFPLEQRKKSHWAWQPIADPPVPVVRQMNWGKNSADAFVLAKLEENELTPAADADRYTIIRRLYFDLIGLPPSIDQIKAFVNDPVNDDSAIAKVVDELLASPHFGERWGRHWLDLVRYAETLGHEFDYPLHNAWRYRDYVIRAFNSDVSYDDFLREHLAGDLISNPRRHPEEQYNESIIGTGFWFLCEDKHAPVDVKGEEAGKIDNQIDVFSKTFLGMTVACARCHDHKFDAISTEDYYALAGFLQSSRRQTAWLDPKGEIGRRTEEILALRTRARGMLVKQLVSEESTADIRKYVLASMKVKRGKLKQSEPANKSITVFADFEAESLDGWEISGQAFGKGTAAGTFPGQQKVSGFRGKRLVNSWNGNDNLIGEMRSPEFKIEQAKIQFLVGGGSTKNKTCINLLIDGMPVRSATGRNQEALVPHSWDVSEFHGRTARIEIVDRQRGPWGHINVDQIEFTDDSASLAEKRYIARIATEFQCDPEVLQRWVRLLSKESSKSVDDPFSLIAAVAQNKTDMPVNQIFQSWQKSITANRKHETDSTVFASFSNQLPDGWFESGSAFCSSDEDASFPDLEWGLSGLSVNTEGYSSARLSKELRGTLRSPTFELSHPEILVRVAGDACRIRLIIDGYEMHEFSELLFKGAKQKIATGGRDQWIRIAGDVHRYQGHRMYIEFLDEGAGWFNVKEIRFANRQGAPPPADTANWLNTRLAEQTTTVESAQDLAAVWVQQLIASPEKATAALLNENLIPVSAEWTAVKAEWAGKSKDMPKPIPVIALTDGTPENEHIFIRGSHRNPGKTANRNILTALRSGKVAELTGSGRLVLAEQMLRNDNPLPARVAVNRVWHHLFGEGIVESTDNFGVLGKQPTHPQLLDHLATRFRSDGWSIKKLIRTLVLSRTYRMSSQRSAKANEKDPTNSLLHRARIRRLTGEAVRDAILTVSGSLNREQFGPSVPVHLTAFMQGRGRPKKDGPLDGNGRRSVYIAVNRNFLSPFMQAFDVPAPVTTTGKRTRSNVPAQALIMLNNEFVNQQAIRWAESLLGDKQNSVNNILATAWYQLFGRPVLKQELDILLAFAKGDAGKSSQEFSKSRLAEICHVLLNSKEFLFLQ